MGWNAQLQNLLILIDRSGSDSEIKLGEIVREKPNVVSTESRMVYRKEHSVNGWWSVRVLDCLGGSGEVGVVGRGGGSWSPFGFGSIFLEQGC